MDRGEIALRWLLVVLMCVAASWLYMGCGGGDGSESPTNVQITCVNNGDGTQLCFDGNGNIIDSNCVDGDSVGSTGQPCDSSTTTTTTTTTETTEAAGGG